MTAHELMAAASLHYGFQIGSHKGDDLDLYVEIGAAWAAKFTEVSDRPDFVLSEGAERAAREMLAWEPGEEGVFADWVDLFPRNILSLVGAYSL